MKYVSIRRVEETKPRERVREANSVHAHPNACRCMYVITETPPVRRLHLWTSEIITPLMMPS